MASPVSNVESNFAPAAVADPNADPDRVRLALGYATMHACSEVAAGSGPSRQQLTTAPPVTVTKADVRAIELAELREALDQIILSKKADLGLAALEQTGLLGAIFPEVTALVGFGEGEVRHKDVWKHTLQVVIQAVPSLSVRWAALFHDIGKPRTRGVSKDGSVHFLHHAEVGARMFTKLARREGLFDADPELKERIRFLVYYHQRAHQYETSWTDSAARRFSTEIGDGLEELIALSRADMTTKRKEKKRRFMFQLKELSDRIYAIRETDAKPKPLPKGLGEVLISRLGLPPSKLIGDIRKELEVAVEAGELPLQAEFEVYLNFVRSNPTRFRLPGATPLADG